MKKIFYSYFIPVLLWLLAPSYIHAQDKELTTYIILNTDCPISQNAVQVINDLKVKYPNVKFVSVFTKWDNMHQIEFFRKKYNLITKIVHDKKHTLISSLSATKTPEIFLINHHKKIIYKGALNNLYLALGKRNENTIINFLEEAIKDYQHHGFAKISQTIAVGCKIEPLKNYDKNHF